MAVFSFSSGERKRKPRGDRKSQERSLELRRAMEAIIHLELYPRSQIDIFVEVLQVDGSDYCASVNAATLALIDAGIPIKVYRHVGVGRFNFPRASVIITYLLCFFFRSTLTFRIMRSGVR